MAAMATTTAVTDPSSPAATRRSMLPRSSVKTRSGRRKANWARRRADPVAIRPPGGRSASAAPDQPIAGVGPGGHGAEDQVVRHGRGHVLGRVHGGSARPVGHGCLHLGHEDTLAADLVERRR